jgi:hypothetical protein
MRGLGAVGCTPGVEAIVMRGGWFVAGAAGVTALRWSGSSAVDAVVTALVLAAARLSASGSSAVGRSVWDARAS